MSTTNRRIAWILGLPAVLLSLLLLWPQTGWLIRAQLGEHPGGRNSSLGRHSMEPFPDFETSLVYALRADPQPGKDVNRARIERLRALVPQFPNEVILYAEITRYYTASIVHLNREEDYRLFGHTPPANWASNSSQPKDLGGFDEAAAAGERLDPANAYFPYIRAAGFLAAHRDEDAARELQRAAGAQKWDEYVALESVCYQDVWERSGRHPTALEEISANSFILLPPYALCRSAARIMTYKAIQAEATGHVDEGLALRHNLMQIGSLMRCDSTVLPGNLVGAAITEVALNRPGGAPAMSVESQPLSEEQKRARRQRYYDYLRSTLHPTEAVWAAAELAAGDQVRAIAQKGPELSLVNDRGAGGIGAPWFLDIGLLSNALWLLALAGIAALQRRQPQLKPVTFALAGSCLVIRLGAWTWQSRWVDSIHYLSWQSGEPHTLVGTPLVLKLIIAAITFSIPALLIIVACIGGLIRGSPGWGAIIGTLQGRAPVLAGILLLMYAGMIIMTAQLEVSMQEDIRRMMLHQGRFTAERTHQVWPGR